MFAKILFVLAWSARQRIGHFKVKLWRLSRPEDLPAGDVGSYNVWNSYIHRLIVGG
jgi:hypothetical protein